jgi:hypothetical protein
MENMETSGKMMGNGKENGWNMQENGWFYDVGTWLLLPLELACNSAYQ